MVVGFGPFGEPRRGDAGPAGEGGRVVGVVFGWGERERVSGPGEQLGDASPVMRLGEHVEQVPFDRCERLEPGVVPGERPVAEVAAGGGDDVEAAFADGDQEPPDTGGSSKGMPIVRV